VWRLFTKLFHCVHSLPLKSCDSCVMFGDCSGGYFYHDGELAFSIILCCWVTMIMWLKESLHLQCFINIAGGSSESRYLADCCVVSTRSNAEEMTRNVLRTWLVSLPSSHGSLSPDFFFTKTTPIVLLPPYKPVVSWADCFLFWNLAISGKGCQFQLVEAVQVRAVEQLNHTYMEC